MIAQPTVDWAAKAQAILEAGGRRGRPWELMLDKHLREFFPQLVKEMGKDYQDDLVELIEQGLDPFRAKSQVMSELLRTPPVEVEIEIQEDEEALEAVAGALEKALKPQ